jgi:hypothetical protein
MATSVKKTKEGVYFTLPLWGTPYTRYFLVENNEVVSIDISRPDGREVPYITGVRHNIRPITYGRLRPLETYEHTVAVRNAARNGGVTPNRKSRVDAGSLDDF